jgi:hypothetical protein
VPGNRDFATHVDNLETSMNSDSASLKKTIFYNIFIFFVVANVLFWLIPIAGSLSRLYKNSVVETWFEKISPSYSSADRIWVKRHWVELNHSTNLYKSYVGWRRAPFHGETINVDGPYLQRRTVNSGASTNKKVYFFGGSTMWGHGSNDEGTIPSQFAAATGIHAENFGEDGWVAHQSLMLLIQLLQAGHRPDVVVFYDGVNDARAKCRRELTPDAHEKEYEFNRILQDSTRTDSFSHFLAPVFTLARKINSELGLGQRDGSYDCHRNPQKSEVIAESLIADWRLAKQLVEAGGGKFVGILQPVVYFSHTRIDHLRLSAEEQLQYAAVYPLIRGKIAQSGEFHDLVSALDLDEYVYLDWCHVVPRGNLVLAKRIAELIAAPVTN